ncbi:hypothetical protein R80B4_02008 [Fibrobacteres bacterium R8-0-B4]
MNLFAGRGRTLMTAAATAAAVVAAGGVGAGCGKKAGQETATETIDTISIISDTTLVIEDIPPIEMVLVEGGTFTMGCTSEQGDDCFAYESPTHPVTLSSYYIGKYEVTQGLWKAVMGSLPSDFTEDSLHGMGDNYPVYYVSWDDIVNEFIPKINKLTGKTYRLPTEAEWEYAARGGNKSGGYKYSGSNNIDDVAWYGYYLKEGGTSGETTNPVGTKSPNELGIYDMIGNVWEWVSDWYGDYSSTAQADPTGPSSGSDRVNRGGSWHDVARFCRVSYRNEFNPDDSISFIGFRLVLPSP